MRTRDVYAVTCHAQKQHDCSRVRGFRCALGSEIFHKLRLIDNFVFAKRADRRRFLIRRWISAHLKTRFVYNSWSAILLRCEPELVPTIVSLCVSVFVALFIQCVVNQGQTRARVADVGDLGRPGETAGIVRTCAAGTSHLESAARRRAPTSSTSTDSLIVSQRRGSLLIGGLRPRAMLPDFA